MAQVQDLAPDPAGAHGSGLGTSIQPGQGPGRALHPPAHPGDANGCHPHLLMVNSVPSSRASVKVSNRAGPSTDPRGSHPHHSGSVLTPAKDAPGQGRAAASPGDATLCSIPGRHNHSPSLIHRRSTWPWKEIRGQAGPAPPKARLAGADPMVILW